MCLVEAKHTFPLFREMIVPSGARPARICQGVSGGCIFGPQNAWWRGGARACMWGFRSKSVGFFTPRASTSSVGCTMISAYTYWPWTPVPLWKGPLSGSSGPAAIVQSNSQPPGNGKIWLGERCKKVNWYFDQLSATRSNRKNMHTENEPPWSILTWRMSGVCDVMIVRHGPSNVDKS